jgi:thiamine monophosphate synthase
MSMFKLIAVTDQASCPENFWTQLQLLAASEIDALIFRAKELPPQEYYRQASQVQMQTGFIGSYNDSAAEDFR